MFDRHALGRKRRVRQLQTEQLEPRLALATFQVTNIYDNGTGSLRQALLDAQASPGDDAIHFSIPGGGPHRIEPLSPLPSMIGAGAVVVDASTQPGFEIAGVHPIELSGNGIDRTLYPTSSGLKIDGTTGSVIRGLAIFGFATGISTNNAQSFLIEQNYVGLDASGERVPSDLAHPSNQDNGVKVFGSAGTIGGTSVESRNVIAGHGTGIFIQNSQNNIVAGNFLGTDVSGSQVIANQYGVQIVGQSTNNQIGVPLHGNIVIAEQVGIWLSIGANHNTLQGNRVGATAAGQIYGGAGIAISHLQSSNNQIGGGGSGEGNLIVGGVSAESGDNKIQGNWVGVDPSGTQRVTWRISGLASGNVVGTDGDGIDDGTEGNLFANTVAISNDCVVAGNIFGLTADGHAALTNASPSFSPASSAGIYVDGARNRIGVSGDANANELQRNVIGGGFGYGIHFASAASVQNVVAGNHIGTDITGTIAVPNAVGINLGGFNNRVGTNADGVNDALEGNVISGNLSVGISVGSQQLVAGNRIGTDVTGTRSLGNGVGVMMNGDDSLIGGVEQASRNVISGNAASGIDVDNPHGTGNAILGNFIGVNLSEEPLGNGLDGVWMRFGATANVIGGVEVGEANVIAYNQRNGVTVSQMLKQFQSIDASQQTSIRGNSIHDNGALGIDLAEILWNGNGSPTDPLRNSLVFGLTNNDPLDIDSGNNDLQNFPEVFTATWGSSTIVTGQFEGKPTSEIVIDLYANAGSSSGQEGQRWLGSTTVWTDANGYAAFSATGLGNTVAGEWITATATDVLGNTSEFSPAIAATIPPNVAPPQAVNDSYAIDEDGVLSVPAPGVLANDIDVDGDPITAVGYFNASHGTVVLNADGTVTFTPDSNYNGPAGFDYTVSDGSLTDTGHVSIDVTPVNDSPAMLTLSNASIEENAGADVAIGSFSSVDPDAGDTFTYTLATGEGDTDNSLFQLVGDQLRAIDSLDFEASPTRTLRVRTTDAGGLWHEQSFVITVIDLLDSAIQLQGSPGNDLFIVVYSSDEFTVDWSTDGGPVTHFGPYSFGRTLDIDSLSGVDQLTLAITPQQIADLTTADIGTLNAYVATPNGATLSLNVPTSSLFSSSGFEAVDLAAHDDGRVTSIATCFASVVSESQIQAGGNGPDTLTGTNAADLIFGDDGDDLIYGLNGADCLFGGAGNDSLLGGSMNDRLEGGTGVDILLGGLGYDVLRGGPGNDSLDGGMHDDRLDGGPGMDSIQGGSGYDIVLVRFDEAAYDSINGGDNTDIFVNDAAAPVVMAGFDASVGGMEGWIGNGQPIFGTENNDVFSFQITPSYSLSMIGVPYIDGRGGNDILYGTQGVDVLRGGDGNDKLFGFGGVDTLYGDAGDDSLNGGVAIDYLYGGDGTDTLTGGDGRDVLYFSGDLTSIDTITDFQIYSDTINLQAYATFYPHLTFSVVSPDTTIQLTNGKKIRLTNWTRRVGANQFTF